MKINIVAVSVASVSPEVDLFKYEGYNPQIIIRFTNFFYQYVSSIVRT